MSSPQTPSPSSKGSENVSFSSKVIYGLGSGNDMWGNWLYPTFAWTVFNMYLGLPGKMVSLALTMRLVWDIFTDPFFGWWSDNTRTRFGRRRPFILIGSILSGVTFPLLFTVGDGWSDTAYFAWMIVSSMLFMTMVSCYNVPYQSLGNELSPDYRERTSIYAFRGSIQKIMEVGMFLAPAFATALAWENARLSDVPARLGGLISGGFQWTGELLAALFSGNGDTLLRLAEMPFGMRSGTGEENVNVVLGAQVYTSILGGIMIVIGCALYFGLKERYYDKLVQSAPSKVRITETLGEVLKCKPFRVQLSMGLAYSLGLSMVGTLGLYATVYYVSAGNLTEGNLWNFRMGLSNMFFGFLGPVIFGGLIGRWLDKRNTILIIQACAVAVFTATWWLYSPEVKWLQLFASGLIAFTQAAFWMMYGSIGADVIDYDELQSGKRREGAFTACGTYVMKIGMVLGTFITGFVLDWTGFDAELGGDQDPSAIFWIRFLFAAVPIAGIVVSFIMIVSFPLSREKMREIRQQLEARRGAV
ncbi:MFS transporter [Pelagicoccus sp. SDUM812003]|uniref:MFS transporter n=1 Tax=Pelagicoccus sp. SDUM812003 TaxID=3041267 RepID=UPI00280F3F35|nr:MFS transporter [Pelagicoccus sp. SDUM812003]MDQ8205131.1 MFS transporter [Pelagicoccus sp. SDUM812003]